MSLNKTCVGREYPPVQTEVTAEAIQKYARAYNDLNPAYFDSDRPGGIIAPPMFGVTVVWQSVLAAIGDPEVRADFLHLVHGEQDMEFLGVIRPGDVIRSTAKIVSIETRATGETLDVALEARNQHNETVQKTLFGAFIRSGGDRRAAPAQRTPEPERGDPIVSVVQTIDKDQTYRYAEASGDHNPIHVNEAVARSAGLPGIIVHGLCTMAFTSEVVIDKLCGGDPARLRRLRVRFSRPVLPGQAITTRIWFDGERDGRRIYAYQTLNPAGRAVIRGGIAEVQS